MKKCTKCQEEKELSEFHKDKANKDGHRYECKRCRLSEEFYKSEKRRESSKKYYWDNKDAQNAKTEAWRLANLDRRRATQAKYRASKRDQRCTCCTDTELTEVYLTCPKDYRVCHIHPISKGGLHCCKNLQHLPASENLKKSNKIISDNIDN